MIFKKMALSFALIGSVCASDLNDQNLSSSVAKGNWTETFNTTTSLGPIHHTPEATIWGFMRNKESMTMRVGSSFNGYVFQKELILRTNTTREEFVQALKLSGIYQGN